MKKLLAVLSILAFLFIAGPVAADWVDDLPLSSDINYIGVAFQDSDGIVTLKTKSGSCMEYYVVDDEIAKARKCGDTDWKDFVKE
jgi:hypothetical protein